MATTKRVREQKVAEAVERWNEMFSSELIEELQKLNEQEEFHTEELSLVRALKKALKELLTDREIDNYEDDMSKDNLRSMAPHLY
ncbi:MAG: hypothetical protein E7017_01280 [Alphaproteobacteria bacterium]|nr:hypothetical protein [Alphaproteobacteria bacterium]